MTTATVKTIEQLVKEYRPSGRLNIPLVKGPDNTSKPLWPRVCVRGEIKSHTRRGINDALTQLWEARNVVPPNLPPGARCVGQTEPIIVTYTKNASDPTRFTIQAFSGPTLKRLVNGSPKRKSRPSGTIPLTGPGWTPLGTLTVKQATDPIPVASCPTELGNLMEGIIRREYSSAMSRVAKPKLSLGWRSPRSPGSDILHEELRAFLAELEGELSGVR